jgi:YidC/Oxa1 family membrane protein insertase
VDNRRVFIAALLSLAVLIVWQVLFPARRPAPVGERAIPLSETVEPTSVAERPAAAPESEPAAAAIESAITAPIAASGEERAVLETEAFRAEFTNRGAQLVSWLVRGQLESDGQPLDLVRRRRSRPLPFALLDGEGRPHPLDGALFAIERPDPGRLVFRYAEEHGRAEKIFAASGDSLLEFDVQVPGRTDWSLIVAQGLRNPKPEEMESQFTRRAASWMSGAEVGSEAPADVSAARAVPGGGLRWVGVQDTHFLAAVAPRTAVAEAVLRPLVETRVPGEEATDLVPVAASGLTEEQKDLNREVEVVLRPGAERVAGIAYFGPKSYSRLVAMPYGFDRSIDWGMFGFLAKPLLYGLRWIHDHVVANYGWAIVLMTVLINLLLLPLNHKSYVSMKKMQELNPRMQAIRERWRPKLKDAKGRPNIESQRKMQEEMNALFKSQGVNPAGGCLPILLQMPVLFAFYSLLSTAIELRGAPWIGWIHDLSAADPYYVLPAVMGITQFIQQRMTPAVGDPMQRRIFQLMPLFFTVLFLGFPSGLVLYWLVNNVLGVARQAVYNQIQARRKLAGAAA